jgi:hypothetical protein
LAFIEFNLYYELGTGVKIKAYKNKIDATDVNDIKDRINVKTSKFPFRAMDQYELEQAKAQLDPILFDQYGYLGYDLVYFNPGYSLGITSLNGPANNNGYLYYSERDPAWRDWYTPNWHGTP